MSIYQLTDNRGNTYAISSGHWLNSTGPDQYQGALDALPHLNGDELFRAEQAVFHFHNTELFQRLQHRLGTGWEFHSHPLPSPTAPLLQLQGRWALILDAIYHGELSFSKIASAKQKRAEKPETDNRGILRSKIRIALAGIIAAEKAEAAHHTQNLRRETPLNRSMIYTGAFLTGLWNAGTDLTQWLKDVNDVTNPVQRSLRGIQASYRARQKTKGNNASFLEAYRDELVTAEKRELVQVLGFDPGKITREQFDRALEIADLVWEDVALQADLRRFVKDYAAAQHAIEVTEFSGGVAFEVLFTIVLAAVTAGTGLAAYSLGQFRHTLRLRNAGHLLLEYASQAQAFQWKLRNSTISENGKKRPSLENFVSEEIDVKKYDSFSDISKRSISREKKNNKKPDTNTAKNNPEDIRKAAKNWDKERTLRFNIADEFYKSSGYEDYDNHLRGIDFGHEVEVIKIKKGQKLYQYCYLDRKTGEPKVGSYFYGDTSIDSSKLVFDANGREMIEVEILEDSVVLKSKAANIEDWNGSGKIFSGGETQLFNPNLKLSSPSLVD